MDNEAKKDKVWRDDSDNKYLNLVATLRDCNTGRLSLADKSVLALYKIHQLIKTSYGGIPTIFDWKNLGLSRTFYNIELSNVTGKFEVLASAHVSLLSFYTEEQAYEFLGWQENVRLLNEYFMIPNQIRTCDYVEKFETFINECIDEISNKFDEWKEMTGKDTMEYHLQPPAQNYQGITKRDGKVMLIRHTQDNDIFVDINNVKNWDEIMTVMHYTNRQVNKDIFL